MNGWDILLKLAKALLAALLVVLLSALIHGSKWNADFEQLEARVETELDTAELKRGDEQLLRRLYGWIDCGLLNLHISSFPMLWFSKARNFLQYLHLDFPFINRTLSWVWSCSEGLLSIV